MKNNNEIIQELIKTPDIGSLLSNKHLTLAQIHEAVTEVLPKMHSADKQAFESLLKEEDFYSKLQKCLQSHQEMMSKINEQHLKSPNDKHSQTIQAVNKKVTRAALARRHEKNQQQMRKDQIFIRLIPKSQTCIQFMLSNRNFPRMEVKLSCNQHLEYLVNYLTNKWIRGKVGFKVVLYPDSTFLKTLPMSQKEKALKQPLNNYLMFTDIMTCCGINQNGVLSMTYQIVQTKKISKPQLVQHVKENSKADHEISKITPSKQNYLQSKSKNAGQASNAHGSSKGPKSEEKFDSLPAKANSPVKFSSYRDQYMPQSSLFNKNSNFFGNQESMFGSLGFNYNFGINHKKQDPIFSLHSNHFFDSCFPDIKKTEKISVSKIEDEKLSEKEEKSEENVSVKEKSNYQEHEKSESKKQNSLSKENGIEKQSKEDPSQKLGTLMSYLDQIQKEKQVKGTQAVGPAVAQQSNNNSNRFKEVKTVSIFKKRTTNT